MRIALASSREVPVIAVLALLAAGVPQSCAQCHPAEAKAHSLTLMAQTLEPEQSPQTLIKRPELTYQLGKYIYRIQRKGSRACVFGDRWREHVDRDIRWAMGQGDAGQTYILERKNGVFESRVSFYNDIQGLAPTIGAPPGLPKNLDEALGRPMTDKDMKECFGCHSSPWGLTAIRLS